MKITPVRILADHRLALPAGCCLLPAMNFLSKRGNRATGFRLRVTGCAFAVLDYGLSLSCDSPLATRHSSLVTTIERSTDNGTPRFEQLAEWRLHWQPVVKVFAPQSRLKNRVI